MSLRRIRLMIATALALYLHAPSAALAEPIADAVAAIKVEDYAAARTILEPLRSGTGCGLANYVLGVAATHDRKPVETMRAEVAALRCGLVEPYQRAARALIDWAAGAFGRTTWDELRVPSVPGGTREDIAARERVAAIRRERQQLLDAVARTYPSVIQANLIGQAGDRCGSRMDPDQRSLCLDEFTRNGNLGEPPEMPLP